MPLETATYISGLVSSNPASSDGLNQADDHLRLIKSTLLATFPNLTGAATATQAQINTLTTGVTNFAKDGFYAGASGLLVTTAAPTDLTLVAGGQIVATLHQDHTTNFTSAITVNGTLTSTGPISGPGVTPVGAMVMWLTNTLPAGNGVWAWANGGTLSRTTLGAGKELFDVIGTTYGVGDGSTTFNVPNFCEVVPVGQRSMGGAGSRGLLATGALGGAPLGEATHVLTGSEMPVHWHSASMYDPGHTHTSHQNTSFGASGAGAGIAGAVTSDTTGSSVTGVRLNSANGLDNTNSAGGNAAHNNVQPSATVNFIIRIA
jgi:microcystin-dependent protein